jgi:hypothetical protein
MKVNVTIKTKINFNGREYRSVDEMPPEVRTVYEKAMGVAKILGGVQKTTKITINGQEYESVDEHGAGKYCRMKCPLMFGNSTSRPSARLQPVQRARVVRSGP